METLIIFLLFSFFVVIIIFWLWFAYSYYRYKRQKLHTPTNSIPVDPVSVIIAFKDARDHISHTLQDVLAQEYDHFEVIAIDDFSTDDGYLVTTKIKDSKLRVLQANVDSFGKKSALTQAIEAANHEILLFTDADCRTRSVYWISTMVSSIQANQQHQIVLGYGPTNSASGWLQDFIRYETVLTAMQYMTYALAGIPYMGVGRNLMYKKSLFASVGGFDTHKEVASGDDDLFIKDAATARNTAICLEPNSFVYSDGKPTISAFIKQKSRHISTSPRYKIQHIILLGLFAFANVGFWIMLAFALVTGVFTMFGAVGIVLSKWIVQMICHHSYFKALDGKDLLWRFPILDLIMPIYLLSISLVSITKKASW